ncbi:MAG: sensor histidine kinase [Bacteroidota bacterium]
MRRLLKDRKAIGIGGGIATGLALMLSQIEGFFMVYPERVSSLVYWGVNAFFFLSVWGVLAFLINRTSVYKILGVLALLVAANLVDTRMSVPFNPVSIPLIILFWIGVAYLIVPQFFLKYRIIIFSVYGAVICYFLIFRTLPNYLEDYHQNFIRFMLIPLPVFAGLWMYEQWRWLQMLKADKADAELTLLKNQINPHFFFNTLNNLYGLSVEKSDQAPAMILKLSDIMRYTIYEGREEYVPLADEVRYLEDYIELHKIRYHKQVAITFRQDLQHSHRIAPLLLIVPLENAFKHGVDNLAEQAWVTMELSTTATGLRYQISNNYEPFESEKGGVGLANLKKRLALIYPQQHQLEINQTADTFTLSLDLTLKP